MTNVQKTEITGKLRDYVARFPSANKAANSLSGVSSATISQIFNDKIELVSDEMWRNIAAQIGFKSNEWVAIETRDFKMINHLLKDAQTNSNVFAICGGAGSGKSFTMRQYSENNKDAFLMCCNEYWNRKLFLGELLTAMGVDYSGFTVGEMMTEAVRRLKKMPNPIIMMDEADKLTDQVLYFFITLYNQLEDHCGIVMCATDHLNKRITRGIKLNKKGYNEIYSRIGRKFIELNGVGSTDVAMICMANGIESQKQIKEINQDCDGDLRRVKRKIHALKNVNQNGN